MRFKNKINSFTLKPFLSADGTVSVDMNDGCHCSESLKFRRFLAFCFLLSPSATRLVFGSPGFHPGMWIESKDSFIKKEPRFILMKPVSFFFIQNKSFLYLKHLLSPGLFRTGVYCWLEPASAWSCSVHRRLGPSAQPSLRKVLSESGFIFFFHLSFAGNYNPWRDV